MAWARNTVDILARRAMREACAAYPEVQQAVDNATRKAEREADKYTPTPSTTAFKYNSEVILPCLSAHAQQTFSQETQLARKRTRTLRCGCTRM